MSETRCYARLYLMYCSASGRGAAAAHNALFSFLLSREPSEWEPAVPGTTCGSVWTFWLTVFREDSVMRYVDHVRHSSLESKGAERSFVVNCMACICIILNISHHHPVAKLE